MATSRAHAPGAPLRLAVLGCGAVSEIFHLPAAQRVTGVEVTLLVDRDVERAGVLGARFGVRDVRDSFAGIDSGVDAVLVALPNRLHAPVSIELLSRGIPVLVEKPMALSAESARAMIAAADSGGALLQIGVMNRFASGARLVDRIVSEGRLGAIEGFRIEWGEKFNWPLASGGGMTSADAGGGVLMDFGSHFLDLLCWWLGEPREVTYADDSRGGVEADCEMTVEMSGPWGSASGTALFSRSRRLANTVRIMGDRLSIEWEHRIPHRVRVWPAGEAQNPPTFVWETGAPQTPSDLYVDQMRAFVEAVSSGGGSPVPGASVIASVDLIERCYAARGSIVRAWERPIPVPDAAAAGA